jgi:hypothetical protein
MNSDESERLCVKPTEVTNSMNRVNQARGAWRRPYKDRDRRHTASGRVGSTKPAG